MARQSSRARLGKDPDEARERLKRAAERCIARHGLRKMTMDDIAREAGVSRPSVYRYFTDREGLLLALTAEHSRALKDKAQRFIATQATFDDAIVEGLLYLAEHGLRDPFTRHLVRFNDESDLSNIVTTRNSGAELAEEFWGEYFAGAIERGEMNAALDSRTVFRWLAEVGLMLMRLIERDPDNLDEYRSVIRTFVLPAFRNIRHRPDDDCRAGERANDP